MRMTENPDMPIIARAAEHGDRAAIIADEGVFTYRDLLRASRAIAVNLLNGEKDLAEARVAFLAPPGFHYAAILWGIWRAGGIAVPLSILHPMPELEYVIDDSRASILIAQGEHEGKLRSAARSRGLRFLTAAQAPGGREAALPGVAGERRAMILYTSGTTAKPKGVVTTHDNIRSQVTSLIQAWKWTADDHILHVLPLHHVHGVLNVLTCALWVGARCQILPRFDAKEVWRRFIGTDLTLFMAVPTIYVKLIAVWEAADPPARETMSAACAKMRLMVSGSAALPVSVLRKWQAISGHVLLERYGMTEIGMALSNPVDGPRVPGAVGTPLPPVQVRLCDERGVIVPPGTAGEIQVKGPTVFLEYWGRPEATSEAFVDGWFRTGDVAVIENGVYRILGRSSVDIIKTGGYKVSALEVEEVLRTHPSIEECAVVGAADEEWGQRVCAALVLRKGAHLPLEELRAWAKERLAPYKVPSRAAYLSELPRNPVGKVGKPELAKLFGTAP